MIDKTKTYTTSGGLAVSIYRTDAGGEFPVHGALLVDQRWVMSAWRADGRPAPFAPRQALVEVKPKHDVDLWINLYHNNEDGYFAASGACAKLLGARGLIFASVRLTREITEGEGL